MAGTRGFADAVAELARLSFEGERARFEDAVFELGQQLLSLPPAVDISTDQFRAAEEWQSRLVDPAAAEATACCITLAAWYLGERPALEAAARRWYRALDAVVVASDPRWHAADLCERAESALQVGALCDVLRVAPESVAGALEAAAAAVRLQPGRELPVVILLNDDASYCMATRLPPSRWHGPLRSAAVSLSGAYLHGEVSQSRAVLAALERAFTLVGNVAAAQGVRLLLVRGLVVEGLLEDAQSFLGAARAGPVVVQEQQEDLELVRAEILLRRGQAAEAGLIAKAVEGRLAQSSWLRVRSTALRVEAAAITGKADDARRLLEPLLDLLPPDPQAAAPLLDILAAPLGRLALLALREGDRAEARRIADRLTSVGAGDRPRPYVNRIGSSLALAEGDRDGARTLLLRAIGALEALALDAEDHVAADPMLADMSILGGDLAAIEHRCGNARAALLASERNRGWFFRSARAARPSLTTETGQLALLEKVSARESKAGDLGVEVLEQFRRRLIQRATETPIRALMEALPIGSGDPEEQLEATCASLAPGWAFGSMALVDERVVVAVTDGTVAVSAELGQELGPLLRKAVAAFTWVGGRGPEPEAQRWRADAGKLLEDLSQGLADPLLDVMERIGRDALVLSAPGPIAALPLLALRPPGGPPLVDRLDGLALVPGLAPAAEMLADEAPRDGSVVALAAADDRAPLISVEARAVAASWEAASAVVVVDTAADQRALLDGARSAGVLHVAAHGEWNPRAVAQSQLMLRGGPVDLAEISSGLDLVGTDLVLLSACQTATSSFAMSGEALNLATFALLAGARAVVASLWDVDDGASTILMTSLHQHLAQGADPARALVQCLRSLRAMPLDAVVEALGGLEAYADGPEEIDAIGRAKKRAGDAGPRPFDSFHMWAPYGFHGLPGAVRVPRAVAAVHTNVRR